MPTADFSGLKYIDFHTHESRRTDRDDMLEILSVDLGQDIDFENEYYTIGKHPWWAKSILSTKEKIALKEHLSSSNCLAIGEIGLDKYQGQEMPQQMQILRSQLDLAQELHKPVIIHCVRAYAPLLEIKKEYPAIKKWCIHGYNRNEILAQQLIDQGFYLSLTPHLLKNPKVLSSVPENRFFLETDTYFDIRIEDVYLSATKVLSFSVETLQRQMINNITEFFRNE